MVTTSSFANECSTIPNMAQGLGPVYNQHDSEWCSSLSATDLLTQKMQKIGRLKFGERLHPLATAGIYHVELGRSPNKALDFSSGVLEGNLNTLVAWDSEGGKLCKENDLGDLDYRKNDVFLKAEKSATDLFMAALKMPMRIPAQSDDSQDKTCSHDSLSRFQDQVRDVQRKIWISEINKRCHTQMPAITWKWSWKKEWTDEINQDPINLDPVRISAIRDQIDQSLEHGSIVGIEYKPDFFLKRKRRFGISHWSSVVGRQRRKDGQCYYQIRNSWGKSCKPYSHPDDCDKGYIWINSDELVNYTDQALAID